MTRRSSGTTSHRRSPRLRSPPDRAPTLAHRGSTCRSTARLTAGTCWSSVSSRHSRACSPPAGSPDRWKHGRGTAAWMTAHPSSPRWPSCRSPIRCRSAACRPDRAATAGTRRPRPRSSGPRRRTAGIRTPRCRTGTSSTHSMRRSTANRARWREPSTVSRPSLGPPTGRRSSPRATGRRGGRGPRSSIRGAATHVGCLTAAARTSTAIRADRSGVPAAASRAVWSCRTAPSSISWVPAHRPTVIVPSSTGSTWRRSTPSDCSGPNQEPTRR